MDVGMLCMKGVSSFGNGDPVRVICEAQGMEVRMYDGLSSQMACLQAYYKHRSKMVAQLDAWIDQYVDTVSSSRGTVGRGAYMRGCRLSHGFSAEHSLFFTNCEMSEGEAVSVFAGPFTVSHHKSTLLIAGHFSFMNAGSGSNQSNHLYKTGPVHHGVLERGYKTGSGSYVMWPARAVAFSVVIGKHHSHFDTTDFPFSYLIEKEGKSVLVPAANLCTSGLARDEHKWPQRDGRTKEHRTDRVHFDLWSPYVMQKVARAIQVLKHLCSSGWYKTYEYQGVLIPNEALRKGIERYQLAMDCYWGIASGDRPHSKSRSQLKGVGECVKWLDLGGMFVTEMAMNNLISDIETGRVDSLQAIEKQFDSIFLFIKMINGSGTNYSLRK